MSTTTRGPDLPPEPGERAARATREAADAAAVELLAQTAHNLQYLAGLEWAGSHGQVLLDALRGIEQVARPLEAVRAKATAAAEADGSWALQGARSLPVWLETHTGARRGNCRMQVMTARRLNQHLPATLHALGAGEIGADHARVMARETTRTHRTRAALSDVEAGEAYLIDSASQLDADLFGQLATAWAIAADPEAADRSWREDTGKEEVFFSPTTGGFHLHGWLGEANGRIVDTALRALMGRSGGEEERSPSQRRAAALTSMASEALDSGRLEPSARVPRQILMHVPWQTFQALVAATIPVGSTHAGSDHGDGEISTRLDHRLLRWVDPATFADGTPIPPALLARLACGSQISRIVFGPASTVLDVGRARRIFPANQVKAVIARDRHCQYPGCHEPPEYGEIHHSLWWAKHNGPTSVSHGILLCWTHHDWVHRREIAIERREGEWRFTDRNGRPIRAPSHGRDP